MNTTINYKKANQLFWETQDKAVYCCYKEEPINTDLFCLHCHDGYEILIIKEGNIEMQFEDTILFLHSGDVLLVPTYVFHFAKQQNNDSYHRVVLNIKESTMQSLISKDVAFQHLADVFYNTPDCCLHPEPAIFEQLMNLCITLQNITEEDTTNFGNEILTDSLLSIILVLLNRQCLKKSVRTQNAGIHTLGASFPDAVKYVFKYVENNLTGKLTITEIASSVHLNSIYLTRIFHEYTGLSIQQYIIEKRLSEAKRLLRAGHSATDVCFECGFNNYSNFSRTFSNHVKVSPRQYQINSKATFTLFNGKK